MCYPEFVKMLEEVKIGKISAKTEAEFKYLARPVKYYDDIGPTELCAAVWCSSLVSY